MQELEVNRPDENKTSKEQDRHEETVFIPEYSEVNRKYKKVPIANGGIRFPVNRNIDVNLVYLPSVEPAEVSFYFESKICSLLLPWKCLKSLK